MQLVCYINLYHAITVIINHFEPEITNFNKGLLYLFPYFTFVVVVDVIFSLTVIKICKFLLSYIIHDNIIGGLSYSSRILDLMVPHISLISYFTLAPSEPSNWKYHVVGYLRIHVQGSYPYMPLFTG